MRKDIMEIRKDIEGIKDSVSGLIKEIKKKGRSKKGGKKVDNAKLKN